MAADISLHLAVDFGDNPMNAMDLPLEENKYWEGELDRITISGDLGGKIDAKKPELSICPIMTVISYQKWKNYILS